MGREENVVLILKIYLARYLFITKTIIFYSNNLLTKIIDQNAFSLFHY